MQFQNTLSFARHMDASDRLKKYSSEFHFPKVNGNEVIYFAGNSLGLQPKRSQRYVDEVMADWASMAVEGHFHSQKPWWDYHERLALPLAKIVGARPQEISVMNTLTVNLHLLMVSFYRPTEKRYKIICEEKAFPSDQYMLQSQLRFHGLDPKETLVEIQKRPGEHFWHTEDVVAKIDEVGKELAMVLMGGVNYYNGQVFDIERITRAGRSVT